MAFDPRDIEEIKSRLTISTVIASHMELVRKGAGEWVQKGNESFTVNDKKGLWCEFGSGGDGKGHDVFEFLTTYAGLDFPTAVEECAKIAGVDVSKAKSDGARRAAPSSNRHADARRPGADASARGGQRRQSASNDRADGSVGNAAANAADNAGPAEARGKREVVHEWDYRDTENNLLYQVVRMQERLPDGSWRLKNGKPWKTFLQRRPVGDGTWILGLDVIDRETEEPLEFLKTERGTAWLRVTDERLQWKNITRATFEQLGNVDHWLYNANAVVDELQEPKEDQRTIFVPEGEGKVDVLTEWGLLAVTNSGGAKHFTEACAKFFHNASHVVLLQDNDRAGAERVAKIAPMLKAVGVDLVQALNFRDVWPKCPIKGDVKDWRDNGGTKEQLLDIVDGLKPWAPEPYRSKFGAKTAADLSAPARAYPWRIKGILPMHDNVLLMGPSRSGKTFEALDMLMHIHDGKDFAGHKTIAGGIIYLTFEGATGFENRVRAYLTHHGKTAADLHSFAWVTRPPNLYATEDNAKALAQEIAQIAQGFQLPLAAIVIDTHNAATRGSSEIKSEDINRILENYQILTDTCHAPLIIIGHTNAEGKHRGSELLFNNIEAAILIERVLLDAKRGTEKRDDNGRVIRRGVIRKQREGDDHLQWEFVLEPVVIGKDEDGDDIISMVSTEPAQNVPSDVVTNRRDKPEGYYLNDTEVQQFKALLKSIEDSGITAPPDLQLPAMTRVVRTTDLGSEYRKVNSRGDREDPGKYANRIKATLTRFKVKLSNVNVIVVREAPDPNGGTAHFIWPTGRRVYGRGLQWPPLPKQKPEAKPLLAAGEKAGEEMPF